MIHYPPSRALADLKGFVARVERLRANDYRPDSLGRETQRKRDMNALRRELGGMENKMFHTKGHKHPEKVEPVLRQVRELRKEAIEMVEKDMADGIIKAVKEMPGSEEALRARA